MYKIKKANLLNTKAKLILLRHSKVFQIITTLSIIIYSLIIGIETHLKDGIWLYFFNTFDQLINFYFVLEISLKLYTEKNKINFFKDRWNTFDFIVVLLSLIPLSIFETIAVMRILRIFRILRLISVNGEIKKIILALQKSIPSIANIVILMFIVFYIYAILGVQFFSDLKSGLWDNFSIAMLTLFRIFTFEDWTDVMYEAMEIYPLSWIYFVSFIIINAFVIFNLFVAVIIDKISEFKDKNLEFSLKENDNHISMIIKELSQTNKEIKKLQDRIEECLEKKEKK